eukprot:131561-Chlamydomonas_euryale.AAC.1
MTRNGGQVRVGMIGNGGQVRVGVIGNGGRKRASVPYQSKSEGDALDVAYRLAPCKARFVPGAKKAGGLNSGLRHGQACLMQQPWSFGFVQPWASLSDTVACLAAGVSTAMQRFRASAAWAGAKVSFLISGADSEQLQGWAGAKVSFLIPGADSEQLQGWAGAKISFLIPGADSEQLQGWAGTESRVTAPGYITSSLPVSILCSSMQCWTNIAQSINAISVYASNQQHQRPTISDAFTTSAQKAGLALQNLCWLLGTDPAATPTLHMRRCRICVDCLEPPWRRRCAASLR